MCIATMCFQQPSVHHGVLKIIIRILQGLENRMKCRARDLIKISGPRQCTYPKWNHVEGTVLCQ